MNSKIVEHDFDHPSLMFVLEDKIKSLIGRSFFYGADVRSLALKGNERVLDFGCGGGLATLCLAKSLNKGGSVLGIDISDYWVRIAAKRLKRFSNAECRTGDIVNMEIPEHSFDAIVTIHVLHHIASEERLLTITKLRNLLKPAGRLMVRERVQVSHGLPPDKLCSVLSEAGFNEVSHSVSGSDFHGVFVTE